MRDHSTKDHSLSPGEHIKYLCLGGERCESESHNQSGENESLKDDPWGPPREGKAPGGGRGGVVVCASDILMEHYERSALHSPTPGEQVKRLHLSSEGCV